ncbi:polysaccharide deacetylase family protein [Nitratidesulfovibrio liaohensis]|uniref:Polysaccharide deacetylase family protein n=1 Tax=Nitratidesulfovibrio liaohensis TaxID=2604158 RepID=A0ABY9QXH7_9BACT|nr:polysaccharide deacetylase family protein [Nitratidesulfovibrio liaohensis]WMW64209.1 polysaccharide deacetylase family protein [Nitratidesulfovibrio liaohensis]
MTTAGVTRYTALRSVAGRMPLSGAIASSCSLPLSAALPCHDRGDCRTRRLPVLLLTLLFLLCASTAYASAPSLADLPLPELKARLTTRYGGQQPAQWGPALPGTLTRLPVSGTSGAPKTGPVTVALTFDACGGGYDGSIIALLRELGVPATLFLAGPWLAAHPAEAADLAADPLFEIANHGARHRPASVTGRVAYGIRGTRSVSEFVDEVESNARRLAALAGVRPRFYRAATLFCDEVAVRIAADLGQTVAGCSVAADAGATLPAPAVARNLLAARNGDILLLHMNKPKAGSGAGLRAALPELLRRGVRFVRLSDVVESAGAR